MALFARSMELSGINHSGFAQEKTTTAAKDSTYGIRAASRVNSATSTDWLGIDSDLDGGPYATEFWHRGFMYLGIGTTYNPANDIVFEYGDNAATPVFRCIITGSTGSGWTLQWQYWNGSTWVNTGTTFVILFSALYKYDLQVVCGTSFEFAITNNMAIEPAVVQSGAVGALVTNIDSIIHKSCTGIGTQTTEFDHSEWIWGDEPTVGHRYALSPPTGNGTHTDGTGSFADVDEAVTSDLDFINLAANGDSKTFTHAAMSIPPGTVKAVQVESRVRNVATGAQNVKARIRVGGVDYDQGASFAGIGTSFKPYVPQWTSNPAGGAWTPTTAGQTSNEFGLLGQT